MIPTQIPTSENRDDTDAENEHLNPDQNNSQENVVHNDNILSQSAELFLDNIFGGPSADVSAVQQSPEAVNAEPQISSS